MITRKNKILFIAIIFTGFLLQSCGINSVYEHKFDFENATWNEDSLKTFSFEIAEDGKYNLFYIVKNKSDYPFSNLYIKYNLTDSEKSISQNLQEITLFDKKTGKPFGRGFGDVMESKFYSIKNIELKKGKHNLTTQQYMRQKELKGIMALGISIEKAN